MLSGELITQDNADFSFGGWFGLAQLVVGGTFSKIPYAVKLWLVNEDQVGDGPALVSGYVRNDLLVFYLDRNASTARLPYFVPDFLRRSECTSWHGEAPDQEHAFEFHVIHFNVRNGRNESKERPPCDGRPKRPLLGQSWRTGRPWPKWSRDGPATP
jgi:hypothetical protein